MTHDELQCLLLTMINELNQIERGREYLQIALEQLDNFNDKTALRVELLVSTYLSNSECHLDELQADFRKLRKCFKAKNC